MMRSFGRLVLCAVAFLGTGTLLAPAARASFHRWKIVEVYSNASGSVQFIDLFTPDGGQNLLNSSNPPVGQPLTSTSHTYNFPQDLPSFDTAGQHFLIATPGYAALPSVPKADYVVGTNDFFDPANDTINYANVNSIAFMEGLLPTDGAHALFRDFNAPDNGFTTGPNVATNFAGQTGSVGGGSTVPLPPAAWAGLATLALVGLIGTSRRRCSARD